MATADVDGAFRGVQAGEGTGHLGRRTAAVAGAEHRERDVRLLEAERVGRVRASRGGMSEIRTRGRRARRSRQVRGQVADDGPPSPVPRSPVPVRSRGPARAGRGAAARPDVEQEDLKGPFGAGCGRSRRGLCGGGRGVDCGTVKVGTMGASSLAVRRLDRQIDARGIAARARGPGDGGRFGAADEASAAQITGHGGGLPFDVSKRFTSLPTVVTCFLRNKGINAEKLSCHLAIDSSGRQRQSRSASTRPSPASAQGSTSWVFRPCPPSVGFRPQTQTAAWALGAIRHEGLVHDVAEEVLVGLWASQYHRPTANGVGPHDLQAWAPVVDLLRDPRRFRGPGAHRPGLPAHGSGAKALPRRR